MREEGERGSGGEERSGGSNCGEGRKRDEETQEEGGIEGGKKERREGRGDGDGEQTDAAQTPEGLRSHIFLASSPGGRRYVRAPARTPTDAHGTHARAHIHAGVHTHRAE